LGFVAGIQLAAVDMVRIGDVIEIPGSGIMGSVVEISLMTIKVEALDKSIVTIPAYHLVSQIFINRRGIVNAGARRIRRSFRIDAASVNETNLGDFRAYITDYLKNHEGIRQDMDLMVYQLETDGKGIPIEIYAFADTTSRAEFENIQSGIFEHLYGKIGDFGLKLYQFGGF
jgi:miniconductance mechanosensitive channel